MGVVDSLSGSRIEFAHNHWTGRGSNDQLQKDSQPKSWEISFISHTKMENFEYLFWKSQNDYLKRNRKSTFAIRESKKKKISCFHSLSHFTLSTLAFQQLFLFLVCTQTFFSGFLFPLLQNKKKNEIMAKYISFWQATVTR